MELRGRTETRGVNGIYISVTLTRVSYNTTPSHEGQFTYYLSFSCLSFFRFEIRESMIGEVLWKKSLRPPPRNFDEVRVEVLQT